MFNLFYDILFVLVCNSDCVFFISVDGVVLIYCDFYVLVVQQVNVLKFVGFVVGDCLVVQVEKILEVLVFYVVCVMLGIVLLLLNMVYMLVELEYFISDSGVCGVVCDFVIGVELQVFVGVGWVMLMLDVVGEGSFL